MFVAVMAPNRDGLGRFCAGRGVMALMLRGVVFQKTNLSCGVKTLKGLQMSGEPDKKISETALMSSKKSCDANRGFFYV